VRLLKLEPEERGLSPGAEERKCQTGGRDEKSQGHQIQRMSMWHRGLAPRPHILYIVPLTPGTATGGTSSGPNVSVCGIRFSSDAISCSNVMTFPV
jgi:hypothetical protein